METETELQRGNGRQRNRKGSDDCQREGVCSVCSGMCSVCRAVCGGAPVRMTYTRTPCGAALSLKLTEEILSLL